MDKQIKVLSLSTDLNAASKKTRAEAEKALLEQKLKNAERESERLAQEKQKRIEDQKKDALRTQEQKQKRDEMSRELLRKVEEIRKLEIEKSTLNEIQIIESKKKAIIEIHEEMKKEINEMKLDALKEFFLEKNEVENKNYRQGELSNGVPTEEAKKNRQDKINSIEQTITKITNDKIFELIKSVEPKIKMIEKEIQNDEKVLKKRKVLSSLNGNVKTSFGSYDGDSNSNFWPVKIYAYLGENLVFQDEISIFYSDLPGKNPTPNTDYEKYLDTVDLYSSLIERNEPIFTFELEYSIETNKKRPSEYSINFKNLNVIYTVTGKKIIGKKLKKSNIFKSYPIYDIYKKESFCEKENFISEYINQVEQVKEKLISIGNNTSNYSIKNNVKLALLDENYKKYKNTVEELGYLKSLFEKFFMEDQKYQQEQKKRIIRENELKKQKQAQQQAWKKKEKERRKIEKKHEREVRNAEIKETIGEWFDYEANQGIGFDFGYTTLFSDIFVSQEKGVSIALDCDGFVDYSREFGILQCDFYWELDTNEEIGSYSYLIGNIEFGYQLNFLLGPYIGFTIPYY